MKYSRGKRNTKISNAEIMQGVLRANGRGFAFIAPDSGGKDFFVPHKALNGAYHGDRVNFYHVRGTEDEAAVVSVVERNPSPLVGTLIFDRRSARVYPDDARRPEAFVPRDLLYGAKDGDKVVCELISFAKGRAPQGKIVEILGEEGDLAAEELSIIRSFGLIEEFSGECIKEAQKAAANLPAPLNRRDLRDKIIFTVDGEDTRDIDDAVSLELVGDKYVLGVHIADVSHYVKRGSRLDGEAYERGTSVYFPDRVLPMLPQELCNGICSLNEGEERYTLTCEMTFDKDGVRTGYEIYESIIKSRRKMTYGQVTEICNGNPEACLKYADIAPYVGIMKELCLILESRRKAAGCVDIDVNEAHIYLDGDGNIVIPTAKRTISQRIIEQFMIAANEAVAEFMQKNGLPCLYRVHESPSPEKAAEFFAFLRDLGVNVRADTSNLKPRDYKNILDETADKPYFNIVNKVMLRSMQKARYCGQNLKHFGLASACYCHFTSPIRRYPDLFVHRSLKCALHGGGDKARGMYGGLLEDAGRDCSDRERVADEAERSVDDLYKLAYMYDKLGEEFDGVVSGVTAHALYCELDNAVEGMIPIEDLPPDGYEFVEGKFILKGKKHKFRIGDKLRVQIAACDLGRMKIIMKVCL